MCEGSWKCELRGVSIKGLNQNHFAEKLRAIPDINFVGSHKIKGRVYGHVYFNSLESAQLLVSRLDSRTFDEAIRSGAGSTTGDKVAVGDVGATRAKQAVKVSLVETKYRGRRRQDTSCEQNGDLSSANRINKHKRHRKAAASSAPLSLTTSAAEILKRSPVLPKLLELKSTQQGRRIEYRRTAAEGHSASANVTPLSGYSYNDQLEMKRFYTKTCVKRLTRAVFDACEPQTRPRWCLPTVAKGWHGCSILPPIGCPPDGRLGYRNKCEFTIGFNDAAGTHPEIGYVVGRSDFEPIVRGPNGCLHTPHAFQELTARMKHLVRVSSIPVYSRRHKTGVWRLLIARFSPELRSLMVVVQVHSSATASQKKSITEVLINGLIGVPKTQSKVSSYDSQSDCLPSSVESLETKSAAGYGYADYTSLSTHPYRDPEDCRYLYDGCKIDSLHLQLRESVSDSFDATDSIEHLWGRACIEECLMGLSFDISPVTFFQTNNVACKLLYKCLIDWIRDRYTNGTLETPRKLVILDVCSGAGTISLCLARNLELRREEDGTGGPQTVSEIQLAGIEMMKSAVQDAKKSLEKNRSEIRGRHVSFLCGKAEDVLPRIVKNFGTSDCADAGKSNDVLSRDWDMDDTSSSLDDDNCKDWDEEDVEVCAVVDPPRTGLHPSVVDALRRCKKIRHVFYVSCNPDTLVENGTALCMPQDHSPAVSSQEADKTSVLPFKPMRAVAVDMFPHTFHCEVILEFERLTHEGDTSDTIH